VQSSQELVFTKIYPLLVFTKMMCFVFVLIYVILWFLVHFFSELSKFELIITTSELKYEPNSQKKIFIVNAVLSASTYHHLGWHLGHDHQNI